MATLRVLQRALDEDLANLDGDTRPGLLSDRFTEFNDVLDRLTPTKTQSMVNKLFSQRLVLRMLMYMVEFDHGYFQRVKFVQKAWLGRLIEVHGNVGDSTNLYWRRGINILIEAAVYVFFL